MTAKLLQDLSSRAFRHGFCDEVADAVRVQRVSPEDVDAVRLVGKVRLWARTTDISERESLKVTSPPVPALLPVKASIWTANTIPG